MQTPRAPLRPEPSGGFSVSGRAILFSLIVVGLTGIGWMVQRDGWTPTWQRWGMASRTPAFSDMEGVAAALDSMEQGADPLDANPGSIWHPRLNHPRIWFYLFALLGVHERDTEIVGLVAVAGLLAGIWCITRDLGRGAALYCGLIFFSPLFMMAIERGNTDLLMFFLLAVASLVIVRSTPAAIAIVLLAFAMKLFPLAGVLLLLREPPKRALRLGALALAVAAAYLAAIHGDLPKIWTATEKGADVSYGYNVLPLFLQTRGSPWAEAARRLSIAAVGAGIALAWWLQRRAPPADAGTLPLLDRFRIGAGVYASTFLLGNSWDYRMIFFFFAVPQLFTWLQEGRPAWRWLAASQLLAFLVATWAMLLTAWFPNHFWLVRGTEEFSKWWLFFSSLYLLARTLPDWARAWLCLDFRPIENSPAPAR